MPHRVHHAYSRLAGYCKTAGGALCLVGTGIVTTAQGFGSKLGHLERPSYYVGAAAATVGFLLMVLGYSWSWLAIWFGSGLDRYRARQLTTFELHGLQTVMDRYTPGEVTSVTQKQTFMAINPNIYYCVELVKKGRASVKGYYAIYPLKKAAVEELENGDRDTWYGNSQPIANLTKPLGRAAGFHVGFIWGEGWLDRAATVRLLLEDLARRCKKNKSYKVFGRPMTPDGLRLLKQYGFRRVVTRGAPELRKQCYQVASPDDYL